MLSNRGSHMCLRFNHISPEIKILLQRHLDGTIQRANQPRGLYHRLEHRCCHLQRGRHGGLIQRGSHGKQIWKVQKESVQICLLMEGKLVHLDF